MTIIINRVLTKLNFKETQKIDPSTNDSLISCDIYENDFYKFRIRNHKNFRLFDVFSKKSSELKEEFANVKLPQIYFSNDNLEENLNDLLIQTTSYGALSPEEINSVILGLRIANETVYSIREIVSKDN